MTGQINSSSSGNTINTNNANNTTINTSISENKISKPTNKFTALSSHRTQAVNNEVIKCTIDVASVITYPQPAQTSTSQPEPPRLRRQHKFVLARQRTNDLAPTETQPKESPRTQTDAEKKTTEKTGDTIAAHRANSRPLEKSKVPEKTPDVTPTLESKTKTPSSEKTDEKISTLSSLTLLPKQSIPIDLSQHTVVLQPNLKDILIVQTGRARSNATSKPPLPETANTADNTSPPPSVVKFNPVDSQNNSNNSFFDVKIGKKLGDGASGAVFSVEVNGEIKALKQPPKGENISKNMSTEHDRILRIETNTTMEITKNSEPCGYLEGLPKPPILGELDGRPAILMEQFDATLGVNAKTPNSLDANEFQTMMNHILSGVGHIKSNGYAWADASPANMARVGNRYVCFDFGASEKSHEKAGSRTPVYTSKADELDDRFRLSLTYMKKFDSPDKIDVKLLSKSFVDLLKKPVLNNTEINKILFFNEVLKLGIDSNLLEKLKNSITSADKSNPFATDKTQRKTIMEKLKHIDEIRMSINVNKKIDQYDKEMENLNHKKDILSTGISFYEILLQKLNAPGFNDHYVVNDTGELLHFIAPRFDVMIHNLAEAINGNNKDIPQGIPQHYFKAIIAMLDPEWTKRPSVEELQAYLNDPSGNSKIDARVGELIKQAEEYIDLNKKFQANPKSVDSKTFLDKEQNLFKTKLPRNADNEIRMLNEEEETRVRLQNFNMTTEYIDQDVRSKSIPSNERVFSNAPPISYITSRELSKSIGRLTNKLNLTIEGMNVIAIDGKKDKATTIRDLFTSINDMLGKKLTQSELDEKVNAFLQFETKTSEHLNPFNAEGKRQDKDGEHDDVLVLKYISKELASYAVSPLHKQMQQYCIENGMEDKFTYSVGLRDQVSQCKVMKTSNGFKVQSSIEIPLNKGINNVVGSVKVTLNAEVDSATGRAKIGVNLSDMKFEKEVSERDKKHFLDAFSKSLPGGVNPQE